MSAYSTWTYGALRRPLAPSCVVLTVVRGGRELRWVSGLEPAWEVTGVDDAGLQRRVEFVGPWEAPSSVGTLDDVTAEVLFEENIALAEITGRHRLTGARCEVALLGDGDTWNNRYVLVVGRAAEVSIEPFGLQRLHQLVSFVVRAPSRQQDRGLYPPATSVVSPLTWADPPDESSGLAYPVVYGQPYGYLRSETWGDNSTIPVLVGATPAVVVDYEDITVGDAEIPHASRILINHEPSPAATLAGGVTLLYRTTTSVTGWFFALVFPEHTRDILGRTVTTVDLSAATDAVRQSMSYLVSWGAPATAMGASAGTRALPDIVAWWLRRSTVPIDWPRTLSSLEALRGYDLDGYVDAPVSPLDWLDSRLGAYPVELMDGSRGVYPRVIRWNATKADAVAHLRVVDWAEDLTDEDCIRVGPLDSDGEGDVSEVRVRWGRDLINGEYRRETVVGVAPGLAAGTARTSSPHTSSEAAGSIIVELPDCYSEGTAGTVAQYQAWRNGRPACRVTLAVPVALAHLDDSSVVLYSDATLGIENALAQIERVESAVSERFSATLRLL